MWVFWVDVFGALGFCVSVIWPIACSFVQVGVSFVVRRGAPPAGIRVIFEVFCCFFVAETVVFGPNEVAENVLS